MANIVRRYWYQGKRGQESRSKAEKDKTKTAKGLGRRTRRER